MSCAAAASNKIPRPWHARLVASYVCSILALIVMLIDIRNVLGSLFAFLLGAAVALSVEEMWVGFIIRGRAKGDEK